MTSSPLWLKIVTGPGRGVHRAAADFSRRSGLFLVRMAPADGFDPMERDRLVAGESESAVFQFIANLTAEADGLLIISFDTPGADVTWMTDAAGRLERPCCHADLSSSGAFAAARTVAAWSSLHRIQTLAVTGGDDRDVPGRYTAAFDLLTSAFTLSLAGLADGDGSRSSQENTPRKPGDGIPETIEGAVHWLVERLTLKQRFMIARTGRLESLSRKLKRHLREDLRLPDGNAPWQPP